MARSKQTRSREWGLGTVVILGWADRKGLTGKMTFEQKPEGRSYLEISLGVISLFFLASEDALYSTLPSGCSDFLVDLLEIKNYADIT